MRQRPLIWFLLSLLCFLGAAYFWHLGNKWQAEKRYAAPGVITPAAKPKAIDTTPHNVQSMSTAPAKNTFTPATNRFAFRLTNTSQTVGQLLHNDKAILLENALIDTTKPLNLSIPAHLRTQGEPGSYIAQSRGPLTAAFRAALSSAGATIVSYIPNNAYLVRLSAEGAKQLSENPLTQALIPFEPYYKIKTSLLGLAVKQQPLPSAAMLNVLVFDGARDVTVAQLEKLGTKIVAESRSPFGQVLTVKPAANSLPDIARLSGVQLIEPHFKRIPANDLTRPRVGVTTDSVTTTNYLNLTGEGVTVAVSDSGVDATHPDFDVRVIVDPTTLPTDTDGHGTHVAGIIAGSGLESTTVTAAQGSTNPPVAGQFRGMAPGAKIYSVNDDNSDAYLQEIAASTNALISNNSWDDGNNSYSLASASYDAAVRDALPQKTGSQPVLFVFAAGNNGGGNDDGTLGTHDSINAPGTAKNVITVGAIEAMRFITNEVVKGVVTNQPWLGETDTNNQVAAFSGRGNVGIGVEGDFGRFKPDVVAPGTFVISTRSRQWDKNAYYNPTNYHFNTFSEQVVTTNLLNDYLIFVPENAVQMIIRVVPNVDSIFPFPDLAIYVKQSDIPTTADPVTGTNIVSIPPDGGLALAPRETVWFYSIGSKSSGPVNFDIITELITTNDNGNYLYVLSNLNETIGPYYRYETGTSMAAPVASGTLALMQEFFARYNLVNSPALMKALLINGARPVKTTYDLQVQNSINFQGWGLLNLTNSIPATLVTNLSGGSSSAPMILFDQSPDNALATGQSQTRTVSLTTAARGQPLRITMAWTDPPANPVASVKLVNDLDLIVTNLDTGDVYYGNDIPTTSSFNFSWDTNGPPNLDSINNVENVYLRVPPNATLGSNYSVTVVGRTVNVNAVTAHPNDVAQDYALVIASGNGTLGDALTLTQTGPVASASVTNVTLLATNGFPLLVQHAGANTPLLGTNTIPLGVNTVWGTGTNGVITLGVTNQWHFYVVTNTTTFTNAAFVTFLPPNLSVPRMGVRVPRASDATRAEADIDLYVSTDPKLLELDPAAIQNADKSIGRGGTELIAYKNSAQNQVYYIGVKSEDQQGAEYAIINAFSESPFSQRDEQGNLLLRGLFLPMPIPDGTPENPQGALVLALATEPVEIRRVVVTNVITHENFGDLLGKLTHRSKYAVLNNHSYSGVQIGADPNQFQFIYEDNGENDNPDSQHTDGPGNLRDFVGEQGAGVWMLAEVDNAFFHTGAVQSLTIRLEPTKNTNDGVLLNVGAHSFAYDVVNVPPEATNLTVTIGINTSPVDIYIRRGDFPTQTVYDKRLLGVSSGGSLTVDLTDLPPLTAGRYYIGIFNPSGTAQTVFVKITLGLNIAGTIPISYDGTNAIPILDDAVTYATNHVASDQKIARVDVAVSIDHPRVSDLAITLISPHGTRVLLSENRGGLSTAGMGGISYTTNRTSASSGNFNASTNVLFVPAQPGILWVDYNFHPIPDTLHVYYGGMNNRIFNSGSTSNADEIPRRFTIPLDGTATNIILIMNEGGNNNTNTQWLYTATAVTVNNNFFTFTENTNKAHLPIKFAPTPFISAFSLVFPAPNFSGVQSLTGPTKNPANGHNYYLLGNTNWTGSEAWAQALGGHLATINDAAENAWVLNAFSTFNGVNRDLWIGFYDASQTLNTLPSSYVWAGAEPVTYTNWRPGEPNLPANNFYVYMYGLYYSGLGIAGKWNNVNNVITNSTEPVLNGVVEVAPKLTGNYLYYLPEESLDALKGEFAGGDWRLELWDNRVGATNPAPVLRNWSVQFLFERTVPIINVVTPPVLTNGVPTTNTIAPGGVDYYLVNVPPNADYATNTLLFATNGALNIWYSTNVPPTITNTGDILLLTNSTNGSKVFNLSNSIPLLVPGSFYYLGVQNTNAVPVTYAIQVTFHLVSSTNVPPLFTFPTNAFVTNIIETVPFTATCTATDTDIPVNPLTFALVSGPAGLTVSTNGIINWTPTEAQGPSTNTVQISVTDTNAYALTNQTFTVTNSFTIIVLESNLPPVLFLPPNTNINELFLFTATATATDPDIPANPLTFALVSGPAGLTVSTNGVINWTPDETQGPASYTVTISVTDTNPPAVNTKSFSVTNSFTVFVSSVAGPFAFTQPATSVTGTNAQLNGMATPNGLPTMAWFQWGTNTLYGNQTPPVSVGAGYNVVYTTNQINGLVANVPHHFRLVASNALAVVYGFDQILDEANVVVWGANYVGQANVPSGLSNVVAIAGAYDHSLALKNNGTVVAWGDNTFGQATVPAGLSNLVAVAGGEYYSMALKNSGTVAAWGANILGQTNVPAGLNNVVTIAGGTFSSLALKNNGAVVAWGANFFGLTNVPASLSNAVAIAGGGFHNLAIKNDGTVIAWGDNSAGQTAVPPGLTNVVAIAGGNYHSLALRNDGTVVAWGDNSSGQISVPAGLTNVVAVAAGGFHSLALQNDGTVVAWGDNSAGQISVPVGLSNVVAIASGYFHSLALTPLFNVNPINPVVLNLTNGVPQTNGIFAGGIIYYRVNVPTNADFATNILLFALQGPLNVWFTTNSPPTIASVNDSLLLAGVTNGSSVLSASTSPSLVPGSSYYLGVNNTNSFGVTYGIEVDFHLVTSTNPPPQTNTIPISSIIYTNGGYLLTWFAPSNDLFQVQFTDSLVPANWQSFSNIISYNTNAFTSPTNTQFTFFDDGSQFPFSSLRFYRLILLTTSTNPPPVIVTLTNGIPYAGNNAATGNATDYYLYTVSTNAARVQFEVDAPSGDVTLVAIKGLPLPSLVTYDYISTNAYTNTELIVFFTNSVPVALTPGDWYLAVVNVSGGPVTYSVKATEWSVTGRPITTTGVNISSTNFCITWNSLPGVYYHVQGLVNLASTNWVTVSPTILAVTNTTTYCVALPSPYNFFRVVEGMVVNVNAPNTPPVFVSTPSNRFITPLYTLAVTNNATDAQAPPQTLAYTLPVTPTNAVINPASGVITWTPTLAQTSTTNTFTTVVTDNGTPGLSATNSFTVVVIPPITISGFVVLTNGYQFQWSAPTNLQFQVQWKTNLLPVINWNTFTNILSSISGIFTFTDDGSQSGGLGGMKFYRLIEYP